MFVVRWGMVGMELVTLRIVRGLFSCVVLVVRFCGCFVSFSVFRSVLFRFVLVRLSVCPGNFLVFRYCFVVGVYGG